MKSLPFLLSEKLAGSQLFLFKFWFNSKIYDGLRYQDNLFRLCYTFNIYQRNAAYEMGCELEDKGIRAIITFSGEHYRLWIDLRDSSEPDKRDDRVSTASFPVALPPLTSGVTPRPISFPTQRQSPKLALQLMHC